MDMKVEKVQGKNKKHRVLMYALSTCAWCKLTKKYLKENDVEYEFIDVDLCTEEEHEQIRQDIERRGAPASFPTVIIDDKTVITGFRKDKIKEALEF
jgi:glutaredoxin